MAKIITVASQKGGVGKTTTVVNLAHGLALKGKSVVVVDLDSQGQAAVALGVDQSSGIFSALVGGSSINQVIRGTGRKDLWLVPGDKRTATAQLVIQAEGRDIFETLREAFVAPWNGKPDYVIFDTAPSVGGLQEAALALSDLAIIPAALDHLALFGVTGVLETLVTLSRTRQWTGNLLIQPTFFDETTRESRRNLEELQHNLTQLLQGAELPLLAPIHRATRLREAAAEAKTIFEFESEGRSAAEYAALVWRVLEEVK